MMKRKQATSGFVGLALNSWRLKNSLSMAILCNRTSTFHHKIIYEYNQMDALLNFDYQILFQIQKFNIYEVQIKLLGLYQIIPNIISPPPLFGFFREVAE